MCADGCLIWLPLAFVPSIIWLVFFAFQDKHREKFRNLIEIFVWGMLIALPIAFVQRMAGSVFYEYYLASAAAFAVFSFLAVAFVEEVGKYIVVRFKAMTRVFFDEPQDAIIYMITSALGFAAIENMSYAFQFSQNFGDVFKIVAFRGISSTFLHVAASGVLGYFLALSLENKKEGKRFLLIGIGLATLLHGIYNSFIMKIGSHVSQGEGIGSALDVLMLSSLLIISGIIVITGLNKLANIKFSSTSEKKKLCKTKNHFLKK